MEKSKWMIILLIIIFLVNLWANNIKNNVASSAEAKEGSYSDNNVYVNISPMKHDIFKQISIDVIPLLIFGLINRDNFFSVDDFENSIVGKSLMAFISFGLYYQYIQPYIVNRLPKF